MDPSYKGARPRSFCLLWALYRKRGEPRISSTRFYLIVLGSSGTCIVLHVVPFHEDFFKISPERRYAFPHWHWAPLITRFSSKTQDFGGCGRSRCLRSVRKSTWWSPLRPRRYVKYLLRPFRSAELRFSELDAFGGDFDVMWRGFVTSVIAAVALQYVDPFRTSKLVLFQVCSVLFSPCQRSDGLYA